MFVAPDKRVFIFARVVKWESSLSIDFCSFDEIPENVKEITVEHYTDWPHSTMALDHLPLVEDRLRWACVGDVILSRNENYSSILLVRIQ